MTEKSSGVTSGACDQTLLPNGPRSFTTLQVFPGGGVPEVMLHLRRAGLVDTGVLIVSGRTLDATLDWWEASPRPARVFRTEAAAIAAIKSRGTDRVHPGDVIVLICRGPLGSGMEETYQITSALKYLDFGKHIAVLTDARFSGVSTGACIGRISPEALAGGPIGKVLDGDVIEILVDRVNLEGSVNLVGHGADLFGAAEGERVLAARPMRADLVPDPALPPETRLWAALQQVSGGTWGGCVYDPDDILKALGR